MIFVRNLSIRLIIDDHQFGSVLFEFEDFLKTLTSFKKLLLLDKVLMEVYLVYMQTLVLYLRVRLLLLLKFVTGGGFADYHFTFLCSEDHVQVAV